MHEAAHLLNGLLLLLIFCILPQRSGPAVIALHRAIGGILVLTSLVQGFLQSAPELYAVALIILAVKVTLFPIFLRRLNDDARQAVSPIAEMIFCTLLISVAALLPQRMAMLNAAFSSGDLTITVSVVLIGLFGVVTKRGALHKVSGFLAMESGLLLAIISLPGLPLAAGFALALLLLSGALMAGFQTIATQNPQAVP